MNPKQPANPLPVITIPEPCPMQWNGMRGSDSKRYCDQCDKHVYNFAELPAVEVQRLLYSGDKVCAQIRRKSDGSLLTLNDKQNFAGRRKWLQRIAVLAASMVTLLTFAGCSRETIIRYVPWAEQVEPEHSQVLGGEIQPLGGVIDFEPQEVMGDICISPEPVAEPAAK